jgi:hypothetical protein
VKRRWLGLVALGAVGIVGAVSLRSRSQPQGQDGILVVPVATGLEAPVFLTAPTGDLRLFVVEQPSRIRLIRNGRLLPRPFLDISAKVG